MTILVDGIDFTIDRIRKGDRVAFYTSEDRLRYLVGIVTEVLSTTRIHIRVFDPNSSGIRKKVDMAEDSHLKYKWLPIYVAHDLEDERK